MAIFKIGYFGKSEIAQLKMGKLPRPLRGLVSFNCLSPGVSLRYTPEFMLPSAPRTRCALKMRREPALSISFLAIYNLQDVAIA